MTGAPFARQPHAIGSDRLRPLDEGECASLAGILVTLDPWQTLGFQADALARYLARGDDALARFVLESGGAPAGILAVRSPWLRGPYIELLAVLPGAQGSGLGRRMVEWAAGQAAATSSNLWACVSAFNARARAFYGRVGFIETATLPDLVTAGFDEVLLRRRL
ncbi:MAG: GNAT family N-acetyltransferase [Magnetospirillum sp.]|nr:GNAT family N-acetyltransferase [Magnetospirillum sp.]